MVNAFLGLTKGKALAVGPATCDKGSSAIRSWKPEWQFALGQTNRVSEEHDQGVSSPSQHCSRENKENLPPQPPKAKLTTLSRFRRSLKVAQQPRMPVTITTTPATTRIYAVAEYVLEESKLM